MERKQTARGSLARVVRAALLPCCIAVLIGCGHLDMYDQAKYNPYEEDNQIFGTQNGGDGAASRPLVEGTFARGRLLSTDPVKSGKDLNGSYIQNPISVNDNLVARGQYKFNVYCVPCHGQNGAGNGVAAAYFKTAGQAPASFYDPRLVQAQDGYLFEVISNGKGLMYQYGSRIYPEDRWAIVAYIRTLQANPPPEVKKANNANSGANGGANPAATAGAGANPAATAGAGTNPASTAPAATAAP